jgi:hypothetical protein
MQGLLAFAVGVDLLGQGADVRVDRGLFLRGRRR